MAEIINISSINPITFEFQDYSIEDTNLITNLEVSSVFDPQKDKIEFFIYDLNNNVIYQNVSNFNQYTVTNSDTIVLDPGLNVTSQGFTEGEYNVVYNFIENKLSSSPEQKYFISEISPDRTEIRLDTTQIPNDLVVSSSLELISDIQNSTGSYYDFYLDFSSNNLIIAVNALLDTSSIDNPTVLIKLYEPLPSEFDLKSECWSVIKVADSLAYNVNIDFIFELADINVRLKGPNFNLAISDQINNSTQYLNYSGLKQTTGSLYQGTGSLSYQLNNVLAQTGITVNIDYSDYSNFIHFSSAQTRLENFYYKLQLLEGYTYSASLSSNSSSGSYYVSSSNIVWQAKIDEIITGFDNYEYYLYYTSGSTSWPKTGPTPPYTNVSTTSVTGLNWLANQLLVAEEYDIENNNALTLAIPSYIRDDSQNEKFELFVEMVGQLFDDIFVYLQNITTKFDADNRLNYGVSKDLVADILRDMGITIYQNNFSSNDVYQALLGLTPSGSLYNLPYTTVQYPVPSGSFLDYITNYVTASSTSSLIPTDDINKERYKRIYHNLPLLLKKKGSVAGLRDLITTFGIPDTILRINEFGGKDKNPNTWDNWQDEYNYCFYTSGSAYITSSFDLNVDWNSGDGKPGAVEFRFKTDGLPQNTASIASQSLFTLDTGLTLRLRYTGSGYTTSSLISSSADPVNPYYQYSLLELIANPATPSISASVYLPFYNGGWWSVLINRLNVGPTYSLYVKDKNYEGEDGNTLGFQASSSVVVITDNPWINAGDAFFGTSSVFGKAFTGSFQEIRYYSEPISENTFDAYVMNPYSTEQSEYLAFRATLGGELYTSSISVHPKVTGSWVTTSSFASNSNFYTSSGAEYIPNTEVFYFDQVPAGIQNAISQKIKQQSTILPYNSTDANIPSNTVLSPYISVQQYPAVSASYTKDVDYVEIAFSPQNEINEDINSQIGYFNIGEVIGDPRFQTSSLSSYPDLDAIRYRYFEKYTSNYDYTDYIRLIKFFDNSLFKMLQDFVPARTDLSAGIVIKNTLLDRNRYRIPLVSPSSSLAFIGSGSTNIPYIVEDLTITGSIDVGTISGGNGGSMPDLFGQTQSFDRYVNITQVWSGSTPSLTGSVSFIQSSQVEFYNGELSGSAILVENGDLSDCNVEIIQVYTTASIPLPDLGALADPFILRNYDLDVDKTYYLSFTVSNDAGATGNGGVWILYPGIDGYAGTIYLNANITPGSSISVNQLEISNTLGIEAINFNSPLWFWEVGDTSNSIITLTDFTIYESYIEPDCLVIANDAQINRPSSKYMDIDFSEGQILPVNQQVILSGSAVKAAVPDSYYSPETGWANARYFGSDYTGQYNYSQSFATSSFPVGYPIDNFVNYFIYYDWIGGSDPQYPGGGNLHGVYLISTEGIATPLTAENKNLFTIENIFIGGQTAYISPAVYSSGKPSSIPVKIVDGGAYYQTILYKSGSIVGSGVSFTASYSSGQAPYKATFNTTISNNLDDLGGDNVGWIYALNTTSSSVVGTLDTTNSYLISSSSPFAIWDNNSGNYVTGGMTASRENTLLPIQPYDFIRFGDSTTGGPDLNFTNNGNMYTISRISLGSNYIGSSTLVITPTASSIPNSSVQNYRIMRRIQNESFVLIQNKPSYLDPGFLIPFNFNPNYNPYELAKKAGVIQ